MSGTAALEGLFAIVFSLGLLFCPPSIQWTPSSSLSPAISNKVCDASLVQTSYAQDGPSESRVSYWSIPKSAIGTASSPSVSPSASPSSGLDEP